MKAESLRQDRYELVTNVVAELVAWKVDPPVPGSLHGYKYRFVLIAAGVCVLRYDNEAGKGDHRHVGAREFGYRFVGLGDLEVDFWRDVEEWLSKSRS